MLAKVLFGPEYTFTSINYFVFMAYQLFMGYLKQTYFGL